MEWEGDCTHRWKGSSLYNISPRPSPLTIEKTGAGLRRRNGKRWMALQIYCRVTGSKDIIGSGRVIALLDRTGSMEKNVCMCKIQINAWKVLVNVAHFPQRPLSPVQQKIYWMYNCYCYCTFGSAWQREPFWRCLQGLILWTFCWSFKR